MKQRWKPADPCNSQQDRLLQLFTPPNTVLVKTRANPQKKKSDPQQCMRLSTDSKAAWPNLIPAACCFQRQQVIEILPKYIRSPNMVSDVNTFTNPAIVCNTKKEKIGHRELSCITTEIQLTKTKLIIFLRAQPDDLGKYVQLCT